MGGTIGKELILANALRSVCENGKETDLAKSSHILQQLGKLYWEKSPDKICLIRSAALLKASLLRQEDNPDFQKGLEQFCFHVLQVAKAAEPNADLMAVSKNIKEKLLCKRKRCRDMLNKIPPIASVLNDEQLIEKEREKVALVSELQTEITSSYLEIMSNVSNECIKIKGEPPCLFSLVGMGSLARKEITLFSDFEHIIVLEDTVQHDTKKYESILEYFRWYSVIFQVIIINLGETILRSVAIPFLNDGFIKEGDWFFDDYTKCGIKFDGMQIHACKFPLGKFQRTEKHPGNIELIKPVSEMVKLLTVNEELKNGYHLADILTKTCFVSGSEDVYKQFLRHVQDTMEKEKNIAASFVRKELEESLKKFDSFLSIAQPDGYSFCDVKRHIYRTSTILIPDLGRLHGIFDNSCFEIVKALQMKKVISRISAHKLLYAISISCEVRQKVYMESDGQDDHLREINYEADDTRAFDQIKLFIGEQSLADYFIIVRGLQSALRRHDSQALHNFNCTMGERICIFGIFGIYNRAISEWQSYEKSNSVLNDQENFIKACFSMGLLYLTDENYGEAYRLLDMIDKLETYDPDMKAIVCRKKLVALCELGRYNEAKNYVTKAIATINRLSIDPAHQFITLAHLYSLKGDCHKNFSLYGEAIKSYQTAIQFAECADDNEAPILQTQSYFLLGCCHVKLQNINDALLCGKKSLYICQNFNVPLSDLCDAYSLLGECHAINKDYQLALNYFDMEMRFRTAYTDPVNLDNDPLIKQCKQFIYLCQSQLVEAGTSNTN